MKIMAIDYGDARTGVAISDRMGMLVGKTLVIPSYNREKTAAEIRRILEQEQAERLVMGLPKNMDGTEGPRAALYREFAAYLREVTGMEVILWDERRTTVEAHQILSDHNYHGKKRKQTVDAVAASLILEGYLASKANHEKENNGERK